MGITPAKNYKQQLDRLGLIKGLSFSVENPQDARDHLETLTILEKELRAIKINIQNDIKVMRSTYQGKSRAQSPSLGISILFGRRTARSVTGAKKRQLAAERDRRIAPYNAIVRAIDNGLLRIQTVKAALRVEAKRARPEPSGPRALRHPIPDEVKIFVWQRDSGRCVQCGSRENLEFDHIIPLARGGSNTARNIQLLCETCNRQKGADVA